MIVEAAGDPGMLGRTHMQHPPADERPVAMAAPSPGAVRVACGTVLVVGNFLSATTGVRSVGEDLSERLGANGWRVRTTSSHRGRLRKLVDMLRAVWRLRYTYDVAAVEVYSGAAFFWAEATGLLLRWLRRPFVLTLHGGGLPAFAERWPGRVGRLLRAATRVTTPSRAIQETMARFGRPILYLPNAVDLPRYPMRVRAGVQPQLCWLRAFHTIYHPELAVRSIAALVTDYPDLRLTMAGPDKGDGTLQRVQTLVRELDLERHVVLHGHVPKREVPAFLARHDVLLNTTRFESFGVAVMEAAACGLCIVSTSVGELPLLWRDEEEAILVPPDDETAMARSLRRLFESPSLAERLSRNAREKAEGYDWAEILPRWQTLLGDVIAGREN